jgi:hypothetical protein
MANTVRIPYSNTSGNVPSSLGNGVLGINQASGSLYYRNSAGAVTEFTSSASIADGYAYDCGAYAAIAPAVPTGLTVTASAGQAALSWTAPTNNGAAAITDYSIQYSSNAGSSYTSFSHSASAATTATITGLSAGSYLFRVAAINSVGTGAYVTSSSYAITSASGPLLTIARDNGSSTFTSFGTPINGYQRAAGVELDLPDGLMHYSWTVQTSVTITLTLTYSDDDTGTQTARIYKGGNQVGGSISSGTVTRTFSALYGDVITIGVPGTPAVNSQRFSAVSISAA